jgi:hypothetical protein
MQLCHLPPPFNLRPVPSTTTRRPPQNVCDFWPGPGSGRWKGKEEGGSEWERECVCGCVSERVWEWESVGVWEYESMRGWEYESVKERDTEQGPSPPHSESTSQREIRSCVANHMRCWLTILCCPPIATMPRSRLGRWSWSLVPWWLYEGGGGGGVKKKEKRKREKEKRNKNKNKNKRKRWWSTNHSLRFNLTRDCLGFHCRPVEVIPGDERFSPCAVVQSCSRAVVQSDRTHPTYYILILHSHTTSSQLWLQMWLWPFGGWRSFVQSNIRPQPTCYSSCSCRWPASPLPTSTIRQYSTAQHSTGLYMQQGYILVCAGRRGFCTLILHSYSR